LKKPITDLAWVDSIRNIMKRYPENWWYTNHTDYRPYLGTHPDLLPLLSRLNSLGKILFVLEQIVDLQTRVQQHNDAVDYSHTQVEGYTQDILRLSWELDKLRMQQENSKRQQEALEVMKQALTRVIDGIITDKRHYADLQAIRDEFNTSVYEVVDETTA